MTERDPLWLNAGSYTATEDRLALAAIFGSRHFVDLAPSTSPLVSAGGGHGVVGAGDMLVTGDGAGMDVTVAAGLALVRGTQQGDQGVYLTSNDAPKNLAIAAADATNPTKHLVVTRVKDAEFGIAGDTGPLAVEPGTPTGGLTAGNVTGRPTPPENALILAEVFVPAGVTSNASFTITDLRTRAAAVGGTIVCTSTTRPTSVGEGQEIYELDTNRVLFYDGTNWVRRGVIVDNPAVIAGADRTAAQEREAEAWIQAGATAASTGAGGGFAVTFPTAFPNGVHSVVVSNGSGVADAGLIWSTGAVTVSGFDAVVRDHTGAIPAAASKQVHWVAAGW